MKLCKFTFTHQFQKINFLLDTLIIKLKGKTYKIEGFTYYINNFFINLTLNDKICGKIYFEPNFK